MVIIEIQLDPRTRKKKYIYIRLGVGERGSILENLKIIVQG